MAGHQRFFLFQPRFHLIGVGVILKVDTNMHADPTANQCNILSTCWACAASLSLEFLLAAVSLSFFQWSWRVAIRWLIVLEDSWPPDFSFAPSLQTVSKCGCRPENHKHQLNIQVQISLKVPYFQSTDFIYNTQPNSIIYISALSVASTNLVSQLLGPDVSVAV